MLSVGYQIPQKNILLSTGTTKQKADMLEAAQLLYQKGYNLFATGGTHQFLTDNGIPAVKVYWPSESDHEPQALEMLHNKQIDLVVNIPKNLTQKKSWITDIRYAEPPLTLISRLLQMLDWHRHLFRHFAV